MDRLGADRIHGNVHRAVTAMADAPDPGGDRTMTPTTRASTARPAVVPRWEWRTVGDLEGADEALAFLQETEPAESDETYVLSMYGDASVKVRDGLLDVKVLQQVDGAGLQLWVPTMKAPFPLDDDAVATVLDALGAPPATTGPSASTLEELVEELVGSRDDLRAVEVHKSRRRAVLDDCMVELTVLTVEGTTSSTAVVEAPDPALVSDTVRRLGLDGPRQRARRPGAEVGTRLGPDALRRRRRRHQLGEVLPRRPGRRGAPQPARDRGGHPARRRARARPVS